MEKDYTIPSLKRGIRIIEAILGSEDGLSALELEKKLHIPKTTIFRILHTLEGAKWLEKNGERYTAGYRLVRTGLKALSGMELRRISAPFLNRLSEATGETSHLGIWSGKQVMLAEVCDGPKHIRIACRAGTLVPCHCSALGKVLLAGVVGAANLAVFFKDVALKRRTQNTITDPQRLAGELERIDDLGYAVDDCECYEEVRCVAAPVRNSFNSVVAAVGITATTLTLAKDMIPGVAETVVRAAGDISLTLGAS